MSLLETLQQLRLRKAALLAVNFYNYETLRASLQAAMSLSCPIILQTSPSTLAYLGSPRVAVAMVRAATAERDLPVFLHLDHATNLDLFKACVDAGYDSAMLDASESELKDNIRLTRAAVDYAHPAKVIVEAELGYIPKLGQANGTAAGFTQVSDAVQFVEQTGVDLLAIAVGTSHGFYKNPPRLDLDRISQIHDAVFTPLVLHGSSGLSDSVLRAAIERGMTKINLATEVKDTFMAEIRAGVMEGEIDLRKAFAPAIAAAARLVRNKLMVCDPTLQATQIKEKSTC